MHQLTLRQLQQGLASKQFSSLELAQHYLNRIKQLDKELNSYITVDEDTAVAQAKLADQHIASGSQHPLCGIPLAHKDNFCTAGLKTSAASKMLDNFIAPYDAHIITELKQAGSVILGKTNMDEFAMGSSGENSFYGPTKNPWNIDYVAGGSSSGSAAAVAALLAPAATGTDTSGSVRQPAAFCNLTGFKPTYGLVSRYGMIALASSLDQAGTFTRNAEDAALLLNTLAGYDARDSNSSKQEQQDYSSQIAQPLTGIKLGIVKAFFEQLPQQQANIYQQAITQLEQLGVTIVDIELPHHEHTLACYSVVSAAEAMSNLARYDGVRYGYRCQDPKDLADLYSRSRAEGFGDEVKRRILFGAAILSAKTYQSHYMQALKVRRLIQQDYQQALQQVDAILSPTTPNTAFKLGEKANNPELMAQQDYFTAAANLAGLPALSMPCGFSQGLPLGLQLIGPAFNDASLLRIAHQYQQATDWHTQTADFAHKGE